jgi:hypothetical protein
MSAVPVTVLVVVYMDKANDTKDDQASIMAEYARNAAAGKEYKLSTLSAPLPMALVSSASSGLLLII